MLRKFRRLLADQSGATAIEYGLICALISIVLIIAFDIGNSLVAALETSRSCPTLRERCTSARRAVARMRTGMRATMLSDAGPRRRKDTERLGVLRMA